MSSKHAGIQGRNGFNDFWPLMEILIFERMQLLHAFYFRLKQKAIILCSVDEMLSCCTLDTYACCILGKSRRSECVISC